MTYPQPFALIILLTAAGGLVAVLSNRLIERVKVPPPALVLAGEETAVNVIPALHAAEAGGGTSSHGRAGVRLVRRRHAHRLGPIPVRRRAYS